MSDPDHVTPELYAAHEQVRRALLAVQAAVGGCPCCIARELIYVADAVEEMIEQAEEAAEQAGMVH